MHSLFRADHIGSFLRPPQLLEARRSSSPELLRQIEVGFDAVTDGEFRRRNFMSDFTDAVEGFDLGDAVGRNWQAGQTALAPVSNVTGIVTSKLRQVRPLTGHELTFLKVNSPLPIKMTLPSATQFPAISFKNGVTDKVYKDHSALLWDTLFAIFFVISMSLYLCASV